MKIGICGHGRAGKDTAAEYLAQLTPLRYVAGTSYWARHLVFAYMRDHGHNYADAHECWLDRHNNRQLWAEVIGEINQRDPVKLYRDCLRDQDFLTGIRWKREQQACKAAGLCDLWIWIERPGIAVDPTCEVTDDDCDMTIRNAGSLEDYRSTLRRIAAFLNKARSPLDIELPRRAA